MNYGYPPGDRDEELAELLAKELNIRRGWLPRAKTPYIEVNGLYPGVSIRRITHLSDDEIDKLTEAADKIFFRVYPELKPKPKQEK